MDPRSLRRARVGAQWLHRPKATVDAVVEHMLAIQAQDIASFPWAVVARSSTATVARVSRARDDRSVVRAWGPRGTLHLIAAADHAWLTALFGPLWRAHSTRRLGQEGVHHEAPLKVITKALANQGPLTKAALGERLATLGVPAKGQGIVHLAALGASHGTVVLGPDDGTKPTYVHAEDWLGAPPKVPDRDAALAELAARYLASRGPATPADLAAWSGLGVKDAVRAFSLAPLTEVDGSLWQLGRGAARPAVVARAILPAYDGAGRTGV